MFFNKINSPFPFANRDDAEFLGDLIEYPYTNNSSVEEIYDKSLFVTAATLLHNRIENTKNRLILKSYYGSWGEGVAKTHTAKEFIRVFSDFTTENVFAVMLCANDFYPVFVEKAQNEFPAKGFREVKDIHEFFKDSGIELSVFMNEELKSTIVVGVLRTIREYHCMQCLIPRYLPWYFKDKPFNDKEMTVLKSLKDENGYELYKKTIQEIYAELDIENWKIEKYLTGISKQIYENKILTQEETLKRLSQQKEDYLRYLDNCITDINNTLTMLSGLERKKSDSCDDEIKDYFKANKNLHLVKVEGSIIYFLATSYLCNYDPDSYECVSENEGSYWYEGIQDDEITNEDFKLLTDAIFIDEEIKVRMVAAYALDISSNMLNTQGHYQFEGKYDSDYMPNPHINIHDCLGNYSQILDKLLNDNDYIMALEQCIASCGSLNLMEDVTAQYFIQDLTSESNRAKPLELPDGTLVNAKEAIEWLKERNNEEKKEQKAEE